MGMFDFLRVKGDFLKYPENFEDKYVKIKDYPEPTNKYVECGIQIKRWCDLFCENLNIYEFIKEEDDQVKLYIKYWKGGWGDNDTYSNPEFHKITGVYDADDYINSNHDDHFTIYYFFIEEGILQKVTCAKSYNDTSPEDGIVLYEKNV